MDSFEFNKIAGAVLFAALVAFGLGILSDVIFEGHEAEAPGYVIEVAESGREHGGEAAGGETDAIEPIGKLLASAASAGQSVAKKCAACHKFEKDGASGIGPGLWDIVNRPVAAVEGFKYSDAMKAFAEGGTVWDYERLNGFLAAPKKLISGTKMSFAGLKKPTDRTNIIAYLRSLADEPAPLPQAAAAEAPSEAPVEVAAEAAETPAAETTMAAPAPAVEAPAAEAPAVATAPVEAPGPEAPAAEAAPAKAADSPVLAMVGEMSVDDGKKVAKKCAACHTFDEGGKNRVGPALWGIMNRAAGVGEGFKYSAVMKAFGENGGIWDYATLDAYLADPKGNMPGNKMTFSGLKKEKDRAAILAYLRTLAGEPVALP